MGIIGNDSDSFPGAAAIAEPPYSWADCCKYGTLEELYNAMQAAGHACTFRGGKVYVEQTVAQLVTACAVAAPTVTGVNPDPLNDGGIFTTGGTGFQAAGGELWLADAATWAGSVVKVEQTTSAWGDTSVTVPSLNRGGLPLDPAHVYVYVYTRCGQRNAVGFETEIAAPPGPAPP